MYPGNHHVPNKILRNIFFLWLAWVLIIIGYQTWATRRMFPKRPDYAREWTISWTTASLLLMSINGYLFAMDMWAGWVRKKTLEFGLFPRVVEKLKPPE